MNVISRGDLGKTWKHVIGCPFCASILEIYVNDLHIEIMPIDYCYRGGWKEWSGNEEGELPYPEEYSFQYFVNCEVCNEKIIVPDKLVSITVGRYVSFTMYQKNLKSKK